jgi:hypothetical protein
VLWLNHPPRARQNVEGTVVCNRNPTRYGFEWDQVLCARHGSSLRACTTVSSLCRLIEIKEKQAFAIYAG